MGPRGLRSRLAAFALCAALAAPPAAAAQEAGQAAAAPAGGQPEAAARFGRGVMLFEAGKFEAALLEFEAAHRAFPSFEVLFNVAVTLRKLDRFGDAMRAFERYLAEGGERVPADKRAVVETEVAALRPFFAEVEVEVAGESAQVELDGAVLGHSPLAKPVLAESGTHVFRATRPGAEPAEQKLQVLSGNRYTVSLAPFVKPTTAKLSLLSSPEQALLALDEQELGKAPWKGEVKPGGHRLKANLDGYVPQELELMLTAGQAREVTVTLEPVPRWYQRASTWIIVGAAAAAIVGGSIGIAYATRSPISWRQPVE